MRTRRTDSRRKGGVTVEARMKLEHREKYAKLAQTLGPDSLAGLVRDLVPRVREALAQGDEHLNSIPLDKWYELALGRRTQSMLPPTIGSQHWPHRELRDTAREPSLPWHRTPGLSLAERVCVLKFTAARLAWEVQP